MLSGLQLPDEGVLFRHQPTQVIRHQPPRFVRHSDEIPPVRSGRNTLLVAKHLYFHKIGSVLGGDFADGNADVHRDLGQPLAQSVGELLGHLLTDRRLVLTILDSEQDHTAHRIREADAIARQSVRILVPAECVTQRLPVESLTFDAHTGGVSTSIWPESSR